MIGGGRMAWHLWLLLGTVLGAALASMPEAARDAAAATRRPGRLADELLGSAVRGQVVEYRGGGKHVRLRCSSPEGRSRNLHRIAQGLQPLGVFLDPVQYAEAGPGERAAHDENCWNQPIAPTPFERLLDLGLASGLQFDLRLDEQPVAVRSASEAHVVITAYLTGGQKPTPRLGVSA